MCLEKALRNDEQSQKTFVWIDVRDNTEALVVNLFLLILKSEPSAKQIDCSLIFEAREMRGLWTGEG